MTSSRLSVADVAGVVPRITVRAVLAFLWVYIFLPRFHKRR